MNTVSLCGEWTLLIPGENFGSVTANVPGSVFSDLLSGGLIDDPYYRDNEDKILPLMENDFIYKKTFTLTGDFLSSPRIVLRFEGLDTLASVYVNGKHSLDACNMHRTWETDVKGLLSEGENTVEVHFFSPTKYIREENEKLHEGGSSEAMAGFPHLRKAHCMFGWDWGPRLPDAGIWRTVSLIGFSSRITDVHVTQKHEDGKVYLRVATKTESVRKEECSVVLSVTTPSGEILSAVGENAEIVIETPELWWPAGIGEQPLYTVSVSLVSANGEVLDKKDKRIGLRTLTLSRKRDEFGEGFCHTVNGVDIFAMGADYVPEDNILSRVTPEKTRRLLTDARRANMNCIRVWGGGYYPDDTFYDICDELGLLVWQDFMFACGVYDLTPEFEENITAELTDNIRRLRHHPSLALWCGNNEMELFTDTMEWGTTYSQKADYIKMYEYLFPKILKAEDPDTFYWPASPSSGGSFDCPNDENRGDVHYWEVWHSGKPFTEYRRHLFRYVSEFGFQSFPCMDTIESFTKEEDRNPFSYVMEKHQRNASANGRILNYLSEMYLYPHDLSTLTYASQLLQAQAMQYGVEHWRRNRGRCMGAVIWQLNDIWPVASWSSIDYYGRWKALHYFEKRFFAPVLISCEEEGTLTQNTDVNAEKRDIKKSARLNVSNETLSEFRGYIRWSLRRPDSSVIKEGEYSVICPPTSAVWFAELDFSEYGERDVYFSYSLFGTDGNTVGEGSVIFCAPKHFRFEDPCLDVSVNGDEITVKSEKYARNVEVSAGADTLLSDNYFDMNKGEKTVKVIRGKAENVSVRSVWDIK